MRASQCKSKNGKYLPTAEIESPRGVRSGLRAIIFSQVRTL